MATSPQAKAIMATGAPEMPTRAPRSLWSDAIRRLRKNVAAVFSIGVILFFIVIALFAPLIAPYSPITQTKNNSLRQPTWVQSDNPGLNGSPEHLLGTDALGRDIFSQLIYGSRVSLIVGFIPQVIVLLIGVPLGLISGYAGGRVDNLLMRFTDIIIAFPDILFVITLTTALRETFLGQAFNGLLLIFTALSIVGWTGITRLVRGQVLSLKEKEFIESARAVGVPTSQILFRHILPNTLAPIIVSVAFGIPGAIIAEAFLTFVGTGMRPSTDINAPFPTSWGAMLLDGYSNLSSGPWYLLFPVLCVGLLTMAFTFLGDGLRDALDPRGE
ncbi:MAG: ABC transporter permease [Roseiflexaceae bacterium]|nr:ABC transporter permease [Roseiflexaceae bacterium]